MDFETSKENIQPLACGRNARLLEAVLNPKSHQELLEERRQFEDEIKNYEGEDPLEIWFQYILWIEQSYPSGGKESGLEEVLIKCLSHFETDQRYFQDRRMIKLYIKYIDSQPNPQEYYQELYKHGIGTMVADLYICWAYYYDLCGNFQKADSIFRKGLDARAQPYDELDQAHKHFGYTMSQRILYQDESSQQEFIATLQERRQALTSLRHHKKKVGSIRTGTAIKSLHPGKVQVDATKPGSSSSNAQARVFEDENKNPNPIQEDHTETDFASQSVVRSIIDSARKKENEREPGPWGKAKMHGPKAQQQSTCSPRGLSFEILEDDSEEQNTVLIPLPSKPNNYIKGIQLDRSHVTRNEPQKQWKTHVCLETENPAHQVFPMYNKCFAYPMPEKEYSTEEYMGYKWFKEQKIENSTTRRWDTVWGNDFSIGIRLYPNFASKNKPQPEFIVDRFVNDEAINSEKIKPIMNLEEIYPENSEEFQIEEILFRRIKNGRRKLRFDLDGTILMEEEMDETRIVTDAYGRKSIIPSRKSIAPRRSVYVPPKASHTPSKPVEKDSMEAISSREPQLIPPTLSPACGTFLANLKSKSQCEDENKAEVAQVQDQDVFKAPAPAPSLPVENTAKLKLFEIFEDEDEGASALPNAGFGANESCSTQTFNFFIKPQSISTPKPAQKTRTCLIPEQNITPPEQVLGPPEVATADSPEFDNVPGCTTQPKQLSTIMETTETASSGATTSTKSSDTRFNSPEVEGENSKHPHSVKSVGFVTPGTIPEEDAQEYVENVKHKNVSMFKIREDTLPLMMNSMKMFEEKTETVPRTLLAPKPPSVDDELCSIFSKTPEKKPTDPFKITSIKIFEDKTETIPKTLVAPNIPPVEDDFCSAFTKTPQRKMETPSKQTCFEINESTTFSNLRDLTLPKLAMPASEVKHNSFKVSDTTSSGIKDVIFSKIKEDEEENTKQEKYNNLLSKKLSVNNPTITGFQDSNIKGKTKMIGLDSPCIQNTSQGLNLFSKKPSTNESIIPGFEDFDIKNKAKMTGWYSPDCMQTSSESLNLYPKKPSANDSVIPGFQDSNIKDKTKMIGVNSSGIQNSSQSLDLFSKKSSRNDSIIPGFEDFDIKRKDKMTGWYSPDMQNTSKSLNLFPKKPSVNDSVISGFEDFHIKRKTKMMGLDSADIRNTSKSHNLFSKTPTANDSINPGFENFNFKAKIKMPGLDSPDVKNSSKSLNLFSKKSSPKDSIIPVFEDFNIKGKVKIPGWDSPDIQNSSKSLNLTSKKPPVNQPIIPGFDDENENKKANLHSSVIQNTSKNLNDTKGSARQLWSTTHSSSSNDRMTNEISNLIRKKDTTPVSLSLPTVENSMNRSRQIERIADASQFAFPLPKDESLPNKSVKSSDGRVSTQQLKISSVWSNVSIKPNSSTKDTEIAVEQPQSEASKSNTSRCASNATENSSKKQSDFFEDNIRTEAFGLNITGIKNSTFLPSHSPAFNISQFQENSIHIKEEPEDNFARVSTSNTKIPTLNRFSAIRKRQSIFKPPTIQKENEQPSHENLKESLNSGSNAMQSSSENIFVKPVQEKETVGEEDSNEDALGQSIYFTKTPTTPKERRHYWSDCDDESSLVQQEHFPPREADLDQTRQYIEDHVDSSVNPFDVKLADAFLEQMGFYNYIENRPDCSIVNKISALKKNDVIKVCDRTFEIMKIVAEGGYGTVFCAKDKSSDQLVAVKQEKPPNIWEYYICLALKVRLDKIKHILSGFMHVDYCLIGRNSSLLITSYSKYGSLISVCNKVKRATTRNVDEYVVMLLVSQMLSIMDHLHASQIVHADIKPDNFLLMSKLCFGDKTPVLQLIDFGISIDMSLYPAEQKFYYCPPSDDFKCIEMLEKRPWTYQTDLFGLAGTIHTLLFGKYMTVEKTLIGWSHKTRIPRYFKKSIWDSIFNSLLNIRDCNSMPNLQNLRLILEEEINDREKLVQDKIKEFNNAIESK